jgi:hypothetical protein
MSTTLRKERSFNRAAVMAVCLIWVFTNPLAGCVCFQPIVKQAPDTRPGKEEHQLTIFVGFLLACVCAFFRNIFVYAPLLPACSPSSLTTPQASSLRQRFARHTSQLIGSGGADLGQAHNDDSSNDDCQHGSYSSHFSSSQSGLSLGRRRHLGSSIVPHKFGASSDPILVKPMALMSSTYSQPFSPQVK